MLVPVTITKKLTKVNFTDADRKKGDIKYLVKHYVGATGTAEQNATYFYNNYRGASAHYFVGHKGEIYQVVRDEDIAWHCGASKYKHDSCRNSNSIGIELCVKKDCSGNWYYTDETQEAAVKLFAYLMVKYDIPIKNIMRHYDVTGKTCGEPDVRKGNKVWSSFKTRLKKEVEILKKQELEKEVPEKSETDFKIKTTCNLLNIRSGAGVKYDVVGQIYEKAGHKNTYTITEEKNGFGKLKSGAGWICLKYTKKV